MRIAMIGQKGIPATYGGIEKHVEEIAGRLVARGHEVDVFCRLYYTPADAHHDGVRLLRRPSLHTKHLDTATHVAWSTFEAMLRRYDIVHYHALGPAIFSALPRLTGAKTAVTVHGLDFEREKWGRAAAWALRQCAGPAVHYPNRTIVVSKTLQNYFQGRFGYEPILIPNGTHLPTLRPPRRILELGLVPGKYVLFVGRLVPEKGVHYLCEAFAGLDTDMTLALAGGLSFSDDYVARLRRYSSDRVRLLGYIYGEVLDELWSNAYLVVQPSTLEGLSIALLEAFSYGRCVLVSDIPENLEAAAGCAMPFRSRDVDDLRQKLALLLGDPALVRHYEALARQRAAGIFSWEQAVEALERVYCDMLPRAQRQASA